MQLISIRNRRTSNWIRGLKIAEMIVNDDNKNETCHRIYLIRIKIKSS